MDRLFAPWRMDWITRDEEESDAGTCIFCKLPDANADREHRIVARSDQAYVLVNNAPYTPGHLLILPFDHGGSLINIDDEARLGVFRLLPTTIEALNSALDPDGFNVGMNIGEAGGASITEHLHIHVVPRWAGDTTFMPTTANSKIVAEALDETYKRLQAAFTDLHTAEKSSLDGAVMIR